MSNRISIVIAYYNRKTLLTKTLESMTKSTYGDFEIVIIDDASGFNQQLHGIEKQFPSLNIKSFYVSKDSKWWMNPCIPNNIGFGLATGDVIIIQNPECLHMGDIVSHVSDNIENNKYMVYGCYALSTNKTNQILNIPGTETEAIDNIIQPTNDVPLDQCPHMDRWYQHSIYSDRCLNFCTAITRDDLDDLGGFDEKYAEGIGFDDTEFIARVKKKNMVVDMVNSPMVLHQWHPYTNYSGKNWDLHMKNKAIYENETLVGGEFRADNPRTKEILEEL